jgi:hypothetical protein
MTGVIAALAASGGAGGGYTGTPGTVSWAHIFGLDSGANAPQTMSGITGAMKITASLTGAGILGYDLNGVSAYYAGAFLWPEGQTLSWSIDNGGSTTVSGTVTVTNATAGTTLATFTYTVRADSGGDL